MWKKQDKNKITGTNSQTYCQTILTFSGFISINADIFRELLPNNTDFSVFISNNTATFTDSQSNNTDFSVLISSNTGTFRALIPNNTDTFNSLYQEILTLSQSYCHWLFSVFISINTSAFQLHWVTAKQCDFFQTSKLTLWRVTTKKKLTIFSEFISCTIDMAQKNTHQTQNLKITRFKHN